jgi:hypothetical protein
MTTPPCSTTLTIVQTAFLYVVLRICSPFVFFALSHSRPNYQARCYGLGCR